MPGKGQLTVLLVGENEREIAAPLRSHPPGSAPTVWLSATVEGGQVTSTGVDAETSRERRARMYERLDRLPEKKPPP